MEATPTPIVKYFDGEKQSIIPLFQRPYTWKKSDWKTLWDDIFSYYDDTMSGFHFMGAVVSIPARTVPVGVTKHLVIDGQQRLTTIAVLLCALRDLCNEKESARIQGYLVNQHDIGGEDFLKLLPTQGDRKAYTSIVEQSHNFDDGSHPIVECYRYFSAALKGADDNEQPIAVERILHIVKTQLQVVSINLSETDDPYLIFESLNNKGQPLSQSDLVRNYVLMRFRSSAGDDGEQARIYRSLWNPMEARLGASVEEFLWHYVIKDGDNVKKPRVYSALKVKFNALKDTQEVENYIAKMSAASIHYVRFLAPEKESNSHLTRELVLLSRLDATIAYPIFISLFSAHDAGQFGEEVLVNCLQYINCFILRRAICDEKRSALNKLFASIAARIPKETAAVDHWIGAELAKRVRSERWPDDVEFTEAILNKSLYGTKAARIVLDGIETFLAGKEVIDLQSPKITIEHIMPQKLSPDWLTTIGSDNDDGETHRRHLDTLGNLTLTGLNSELGNKGFSEKRNTYQNSGIAMNRKIAEELKWEPHEMERRAQFLAEHALRLWPRYSPSAAE